MIPSSQRTPGTPRPRPAGPQATPLVAAVCELRLEAFSLRGDEGGWKQLLGLVGEQLTGRGAVPELLLQAAQTLVACAGRAPAALRVSGWRRTRRVLVCQRVGAEG